MDALERERQLCLEYQPIVDLHTERVLGVEVLIRWRHPTRGVLSPCEFIPLAEETGQIVPIGRWALSEATRQAAQWARDGHELGVAVNVSARQLDADELVGDVRRALGESGLRPGALTLEITETALMRDARAAVSDCAASSASACASRSTTSARATARLPICDSSRPTR